MPDRAERGPREPWWLIPKGGRSRRDLDLPPPFFERYRDPLGYDPGPALTSAVNLALLLGQPLLVTGDPGSGKTSLAYWLAHQMGCGLPLEYVVKSSTSGKDLLYSFDELARFRDARGGPAARRPQQTYLELNALGQAILFSAGPEGELRHSKGYEETADRPLRHADLYSDPFPASGRQVVLIDEIDKAPRDTPNDLLSEIERMQFRIPELGVTVAGDPRHRPAVVITSNSDKSLPDAFLRRCVYHNIPPPNLRRRREILELRAPALAGRPQLCDDALDTYEEIYEAVRREGRRPGTAEFLAWLDAVDSVYPKGATSLMSDVKALAVTLGAVAKTRDDMRRIAERLGIDPRLLGAA